MAHGSHRTSEGFLSIGSLDTLEMDRRSCKARVELAGAGMARQAEHTFIWQERAQLPAFHAAARGNAPVSTPIERARRNVERLVSAFGKEAAA